MKSIIAWARRQDKWLMKRMMSQSGRPSRAIFLLTIVAVAWPIVAYKLVVEIIREVSASSGEKHEAVDEIQDANGVLI